MKEVTLSVQQVQLCTAVLSQDLMKTCALLGKDEDASGNPLDDEGRYELTRLSMELQLTLLALGMTSDQLARIVKDFSKLS
jgi:hypothetical protein